METSTLAVQPISITKIKTSAENPRHIVKPESVEMLAASMKAVGQETPIKLRKLGINPEKQQLGKEPYSGTEVASSLAPAYSAGTPSGFAEATPDKRNDSDYEFELIGGHLRLEAAKKLGWETLNAMVLEVSDDQAELAAILDNQGEDMHWLDWYQAIERRLSAPSKPTQQQVAEELGIVQGTVSRALKVTKYLNHQSRDQIYLVQISNERSYEVPETVVFSLSGLEDPEKVQNALKVVIDRQMTEKEAKKLVEWVKKGNTPEAYESSGKGQNGEKALSGTEVASSSTSSYSADTPSGFAEATPDKRNDSRNCDMANDPYASYWEPLPDYVKVQMEDGGYVATLHLTPTQAPIAVYGAMAWLEHIKGIVYEGTSDMRYNDAWPKLVEEARKSSSRSAVDPPSLDIAAAQLRETSSRQQDQRPGEEALSGTGSTGSPQAGVASSLTPAYPSRASGPRANSEGSAGTPSGFAKASGSAKATPDKPSDKRNDGEEIKRQAEAHEEVAESPAGSEMPKPEGGLLSQMAQEAKEKLKLTPKDIADGLLQDGKRAVNYEIRRGMRDMLGDMF